MKKLLLTTMVLGSTVAVAACSGTSSEDDLDGGLTNAPYTEERTIATNNTARVTSGSTAHSGAVAHGHSQHSGAAHSGTTLRSAEPVFERGLVK